MYTYNDLVVNIIAPLTHSLGNTNPQTCIKFAITLIHKNHHFLDVFFFCIVFHSVAGLLWRLCFLRTKLQATRHYFSCTSVSFYMREILFIHFTTSPCRIVLAAETRSSRWGRRKRMANRARKLRKIVKCRRETCLECLYE